MFDDKLPLDWHTGPVSVTKYTGERFAALASRPTHSASTVFAQPSDHNSASHNPLRAARAVSEANEWRYPLAIGLPSMHRCIWLHVEVLGDQFVAFCLLPDISQHVYLSRS